MKDSGSLKVVFAGTPEFAARHLRALLDSGQQVIAVYTQPDRPSGRGKQLLPSPVKELAVARGIPVLQPASLKGDGPRHELAGLDPDVMVVVAYGLILPASILQTPRLGCINVHASLLPRWRGAAPVERALLAGDSHTGITIMQMDAGLDTGPMLHRVTVPISGTDTRVSLEQKLAEAGAAALVYAIDRLEELRACAEPQDNSRSTYASKVDKQEALIDWNQGAGHICRQVRAGIGRYPAYSHMGGTRVRILSAQPETAGPGAPPGTIIELSRGGMLVACGDGCIRVAQVQLPGKNPVALQDLLNSRQDLLYPGGRFTNAEAA